MFGWFKKKPEFVPPEPVMDEYTKKLITDINEGEIASLYEKEETSFTINIRRDRRLQVLYDPLYPQETYKLTLVGYGKKHDLEVMYWKPAIFEAALVKLQEHKAQILKDLIDV